jgi:hypothetical protein
VIPFKDSKSQPVGQPLQVYYLTFQCEYAILI